MRYKNLSDRLLIVGILLFVVGFTAYGIATGDLFSSIGGIAFAQYLVAADDGSLQLLGKGKRKPRDPSAPIYVKGSIDGGVNITTALATNYSVFGQNQAALNNILPGSGVLTNQTGPAGTYSEEGHIKVKALKFNIVNLFTTALDYFTVKQLAQYSRASFSMGNYILWEGWLYSLLREDLLTYNTAAPADSILVSNCFNTVSLDNDGYTINKNDSFQMNINVTTAVALPAAEVLLWYFTCSLLGKKTLPRVAKS